MSKREYFRNGRAPVMEYKDVEGDKDKDKGKGKGKEKEGDDENPNAELLKEVKALITKQDDTTKKHADEIKKAGEATAETKKELAEINEKVGKTALQILDLAQRISRQPGAEQSAAYKSIGQRFVEDKDVKAFLEKGGKGSVQIKVDRDDITIQQKTTITTGTLPAPTSGVLPAQRVPGIIMPQLRQLRIRDLLPAGRTTSNALDYVKELLFTNAAAPVAEAALKPEAALTFAVSSAPVRTIAHWIPATRQVLDDFVQLRGYIDNRLMYGLQLVEENQLLAGDGTGQNILGIIPQATAYDGTRTKAGDTKIDVIRHAIAQARIAEFPVDGIVLHPDDWEAIELVKASTGEYIIGDPLGGLLPPRIWGRNVVDTTAITSGTFLVGAFQMGAQIWDRQDAVVEISTEHSDFFVRNMVAIRCEERLALTVYRPSAFITGVLP